MAAATMAETAQPSVSPIAAIIRFVGARRQERQDYRGKGNYGGAVRPSRDDPEQSNDNHHDERPSRIDQCGKPIRHM